jgi:uncharacterized membrane protein YgcG
MRRVAGGLVAAGLVALAGLLVVGTAGRAEAKAFTFPEVVVDATILPDGSMDLVEHRTFLFTGGTFTIGTFAIDWPHDLVRGFRVSQGGNPLVAVDLSPADAYRSEFVFPRPETGRQTFDISYRVRCAVHVYTDRAHLYWQFVGTSDAGTAHVVVTLHVPPAATGPVTRAPSDCPPPPARATGDFGTRPLRRGEVRAKAFGPANGSFRIPDPQTVVLEVRDVPADGFVEGSVLMPPSVVPLAFQQDHPITRDELVREPVPGGGSTGEPAGASLGSRELRHRLALILLAGLPVLWIGTAVVARLRDRVGIPDDVTEPPEEIDPVDLAVLWGMAQGQTFSFTAYATEILHLARTGVIDMAPVGTVSKPTDFHLKLMQQPESDVDRDFVTFLFGTDAAPGAPPRPDVAGAAVTDAEDGRVSLQALRRRGSNSRLKKWSNDAVAHVKSRVGTVPKQHKRFARRFVFWTAIAGIVVVSVLSISSGDPGALAQVSFWEAFLVGGACALTIPPKLDPEFRARMAPWRAFRRYLKEFSSLPDAPALAVVIWERYLEYATALGVAKEVAKQVGTLVPADRLAPPWPGAPQGLNAVVWVSSLHTLAAIPPSRSVSSGSSGSGISSFSSFGGGFSGGGGFGGGGTHVGAR